MKKELIGTIIKIIDDESGYIKGEDNIKYFFTTLNFTIPFEPEVDLKVTFKPNFIKKLNTHTATLISIIQD